MKKVLIIDDNELFRDYLKEKLTIDQTQVIISQKNRDDFTKLISTFPNLVVLNIDNDPKDEIDFLEQKAANPNLVSIPVIILGPELDNAHIASYAKYGVVKYFKKPVQFDTFYEAIGSILKMTVSLDYTKAFFDIHHNGNIVFLEFSEALNQDKIALITYKLTNMIKHESLESPKIIIMLSALDLTFVDGYNLECLIDNVLKCEKIHPKYVKILSKSPFLNELINGHENYAGIEISDNLPQVLTSLMDTSVNSTIYDLISDRVISSSAISDSEQSIIKNTFRFDSNKELTIQEDGTVLSVAIVDSDTQNLVLTRTVFESVNAKVDAYTNGTDFFVDYQTGKYNLIILDILLSDDLGFEILSKITKQNGAPPIIVYSQTLQKDVVVKVLSSGARSYLVKPLKPNVLLQKCLNILHI